MIKFYIVYITLFLKRKRDDFSFEKGINIENRLVCKGKRLGKLLNIICI